MAKIREEIPKRSFEAIRDRVAVILKDEIDNQVINGYNVDCDAGIYVERFTPFDETELPAINVCLASGDFNDKTAPASNGAYIYNIDVYGQHPAEGEKDGDTLASILVQKIMGIIWSILENPVYNNLGYPRGSVSGVKITSLTMIDHATLQKQDMLNSTFGRLQLMLKAAETVELQLGILADGFDTKVTLGDSGKGYSFTVNQ